MIIDDDVVDDNEVINLSATLATTNSLITLNGSATITIVDDGEYSQDPRLPNTQFTQNKRHHLFSSLSLFVNSNN